MAAENEETPLELLTGGITRPGIRDISDWKTFHQTLRENKEARSKGTDKVVVSSRTFRNRSSNINVLKEKTRDRLQLHQTNRKVTPIDDKEEVYPSEEELLKSLSKVDEMKVLKGYKPAPSSRYHVTLFEEYKVSGAEDPGAADEDKFDADRVSDIVRASPPPLSRATIVSTKSQASTKSRGSVSKRMSIKSSKFLASSKSGASVSLPDISKSKSEKYFGADAKSLFYDTYHEIGRRKNICLGGYDEMDELIQQSDTENVLKESMRSLTRSGVLTPPSTHRSPLAFNSATTSPVPSISENDDAATAATTPALSPTLAPTPTQSQSQMTPTASLLSSSTPINPFSVSDVGSIRSIKSTKSKSKSNQRFLVGPSTTLKGGGSAPPSPTRPRTRTAEGGLVLGGNDSVFDDESLAKSATSRQISPLFDSVSTWTDLPNTASVAAEDSKRRFSIDLNDKAIDAFVEDMSKPSYCPNSPRAIFLNGCLKHNLPPRAVAILRRNMSTSLDLAHIGLGDTLGILLAKSLASIPALKCLNLEDNNLTDPGLTAILSSLSGNPDLEELNIGMNKIDSDAAEALRNYIGNPDCTLRSLHLKQADIDDGECAEFVAALMQNRHLEELDLSNNLLGKDENLNAIYPDLVTGGESLAELICDGSCPLKSLKLKWNMIRLGGANDLCDSLRNSATLQYLDLSYNALGQEASSILGSALLENKALTTLILSNNGIDSVGAFTLAVGMRENKSLQFVNLDGNPIGEQGAVMLMQVAIYCGSRLRFSVENCDLNVTAANSVLKYQEPTGSYSLDMSNCYQRAVAYTLFDIVCDNDQLQFKTGPANVFEYFDPADPKTAVKIPLSMLEVPQELDDDDLDELDMLENLISKTESAVSIVKLFKEFDEDGSGGLDAEELQSLLDILGIEVEIDKIKAIISVIDIDGKGTIDVDETVNYVTHIRINAEQRIHCMKNKRRYANANGPASRLIPWSAGRINAQVSICFGMSDYHQAMSFTQMLQVLEAAKSTSNSTNGMKMIQLSLKGAKLHLTEAQYMLDGLNEISGNVVAALENILPGMMSVIEAQQLLKIGIKSDFAMLRELRRRLGSSFYPTIGYFTGYYRLDLMKANDRQCLFLLLQRSYSYSQQRELNGFGDISQNGNNSCFRNTNWYCQQVRKIGEKIGIEQFFPIPERGTLEFDFVDWEKPNIHLDRAMGDDKVIRMLESCRLIKTEKQVAHAWSKINEMKIGAKRTIRETGYSYWKPDTARAMMAAEYLNELYTHKTRGLEKRFSSLKKAQKKEKVGEKKDETAKDDAEVEEGSESESEGEGGEASEAGDAGDAGDGGEGGEGGDGDGDEMGDFAGDQDGEDPSSPIRRSADGEEKTPIKPVASVSKPVEPSPSNTPVGRQISKKTISSQISEKSKKTATSVLNALAKAKTLHEDEDMGDGSVSDLRRKRAFDALLASKRATAENKSLMVLEFIESMLLGRRMYCRQLALIVDLFRVGIVNKSNMGSYRVEFIVNAFHRILDLHNFELVLKILTAREHAAIIARLGWMTIFNPCKPDGAYELDMTRWEERQIFKILLNLHFKESGASIRDVQYIYERGYIPTPGADITPSFASDEIKPQGIYRCEFVSGEGLMIGGVKPNRALRNQLLSVVLTSHEEITLEEHMFEEMETKSASRPSTRSARAEKKPVCDMYHTLLKEIEREKPNLATLHSSLKAADPVSIDWTYKA